MDKLKTVSPPCVMAPEVCVEPTNRSKKHVILTSWASVATALLLVLLIGGAFYVADLKSEAKAEDTPEHNKKSLTRTFDNEGDVTKEDIVVDEDEQTTLIFTKDTEGNIQLISAQDYKKKILAAYVPAQEICLLFAGEDMKWIDDWGDKEAEVITLKKEDVKKHSYKTSDNKVTDLSILPKEMKVYCDGKPVYWLQPEEADTEDEEERERTEEEEEEDDDEAYKSAMYEDYSMDDEMENKTGGIRVKRGGKCCRYHCTKQRCEDRWQETCVNNPLFGRLCFYTKRYHCETYGTRCCNCSKFRCWLAGKC